MDGSGVIVVVVVVENRLLTELTWVNEPWVSPPVIKMSLLTVIDPTGAKVPDEVPLTTPSMVDCDRPFVTCGEVSDTFTTPSPEEPAPPVVNSQSSSMHPLQVMVNLMNESRNPFSAANQGALNCNPVSVPSVTGVTRTSTAGMMTDP